MQYWVCDNCSFEFDAPQPRNRCAQCGFHLRTRYVCDSCGVDLGRYIVTDTSRKLCEHHLPDVLAESIGVLGGTPYA